MNKRCVLFACLLGILATAVLAADTVPSPRVPESKPEADIPMGLDKKDQAALLDMLKDDRPQYKASAARELGNRKAKSARPLLQTMLQDTFEYVRLESAIALLKMDDTGGVQVLRELLKSKVSFYAIRAAEGLMPQGDSSAIATAKSFQTNPNFALREAALRALSCSKNEDTAYSAIDAGLKDSQHLVRCTAIDLLAARPNKRSLDLAASYLSDPNPRIRLMMVTAIGQIGLPSGIPALLDALADKDAAVRHCAASVLNRLAGQEKPTIGTLSAEGAKKVETEWRKWWEANQDKVLAPKKK